MPKLPGFVQEAMPLYEIVKELDESQGVIQADLQDLPQVDPDQRITIGRLVGMYGKRIGPNDGIEQNEDRLLEVVEQDFANARPAVITRGLYIPGYDRRFMDSRTEQLVRVAPKKEKQQEGVVFPAEEFPSIARNARDLSYHMMARTRGANAANKDRIDVDGRVGRSAGHIMEDKIKKMNVLENSLLKNRSDLLIPLYRETYSDWQSHFKAENLDKKRKEFDEQLHYTIETASINQDIGSTAIKAAHRAAFSNMYRRGSSKEINNSWQGYVRMVGEYVSKRVAKIEISRANCHEQLAEYQPFLDAKARPAAA